MMIDKIKSVLNLNKLAYDTVRKEYRQGMTEKDIKTLILSACQAEDFSGDIIAGIRSGKVEGDATDYVLSKGDCLILDLQFKKGSMWSDTTRTFFIGTPDKEVRLIYDAVLCAKAAGEQMLKSNISACEVYAAVNGAFAELGKHFPHHAGHRFGTERVMQPQFLPEKSEKLQTGMTVTLEPGLYFENKFGIRLEDNYLVTESGFINLFDYTTKIDDFII